MGIRVGKLLGNLDVFVVSLWCFGGVLAVSQ